MNHEDGCFCELAPLYSLDLLPLRERRWVEQQAADSSELAAELAELQATVGALSYAAPVVPVAADLKDRLFQRLSQESNRVEPIADFTSAPGPTIVRDRLRHHRPWFASRSIQLLIGGAIAALAVVALRVENNQLRQSALDNSALIEVLQQPDAIVYTLRGTPKAATASGRLVVSPSQKTVAVLVQNLPQLPSGQAYRLWAMPIGATQPTYCGQFDAVTGMGAPAHWFPTAAVCSTTVAQMLITTDLATAPPVPTDSLVMKGVL